ncbi:MAG: hypothetical protein GY856_04240 [bacterium]|nr:hypothetical protein [bacterium]
MSQPYQQVSLNDLTDLLNEVEISDEATWRRILDRVAEGAPIETPSAAVLARNRNPVDPFHRARYQR